MVGAIADWFAVTALFRHPLGLPIPHTALIPRRKDDLGRGLQDFVGENFLQEDVIRERLASAEVGRRVGTWLADPAHARTVVDEASEVALETATATATSTSSPPSRPTVAVPSTRSTQTSAVGSTPADASRASSSTSTWTGSPRRATAPR